MNLTKGSGEKPMTPRPDFPTPATPQATILRDHLLLQRQRLSVSIRDLVLYLQGAGEAIRLGHEIASAEIKARSIMRDASEVARLLGAIDALQAAEAILAPKGAGVAALIPERGL